VAASGHTTRLRIARGETGAGRDAGDETDGVPGGVRQREELVVVQVVRLWDNNDTGIGVGIGTVSMHRAS
jgi:hypothetical protein